MTRFAWPVLRSKSNKHRTRRPQRKLTMESLEGRQMLSAVTLNPVRDNTLIENVSGSRSNGAGDIFVGLNADQNRIRRGLIDFDVAGSVPAGATINSVTLTMYVSKTKVGAMDIELHKVLADWGEAGSSGDGNGGSSQTGDATWLHTFYNSQSWASAGGDFSPTVSGVQSIGSSGASYTWTSTAQMVADVQDWLDNPSTDHGWLLQGQETQRSAKRFGSSESGNAAQRPALAIDYTEASASNEKADIVGRTSDGEWWAARSDGTQFINEFVADWPTGETWQDVQLADVNGDGQEDIVGRDSSGDWHVSLSNQYAQTLQQWGHWSSTATWEDVQTADVNGDGLDDIVGRIGGDWWVAQSTGTYFTTSLWGRWSNAVVWEDVRVGDFDGDGNSDIAGRTSGSWWLARSNGTNFVTELWGHWSNSVTWDDVVVGDFDGNGSDDLAGRTSGDWWLAKSAGTHFVTEHWGSWSNAVTWSDVTTGDFDGDGSTDIAGQTGGQWWLARSSQNSFFLVEYWGRWSNVAWQDVSFGDFDGDGDDDIAGRFNNEWWVAKSQATSFSFEHWGQWGPTTWVDVMAGVHRRDDNGGIGP